jgi:hypothetical protein
MDRELRLHSGNEGRQGLVSSASPERDRGGGGSVESSPAGALGPCAGGRVEGL